MKLINLILRALCLVALLCLTSVNAMAYDLIQTNDEKNRLATNDEHITALGGNVSLSSLYVDVGDAAIILPGASVKIKSKGILDNHGTIYIFGTLDASAAIDFNNSDIIYLVEGGSLYGAYSDLNPPKNITESAALNKTIKYEGRPVTETEHGLRDYWEKGIEFNGDYCPIFYYTDEACTNKISDIENWKKDGRIIYSLPLYQKEAIEAIDNEINGMTILTEEDMQIINGYKADINNATEIKEIDKAKNAALEFIHPKKVKDTALAAIRSAMQGETSAYLTGLVQTYIDIIYNSDDESEIKDAQNAAVKIINGVIDTYEAIKADVIGTLGTKQDGPALIVTDKDGKEIILYNPKSVEYIKVKEE